MSVGLYRVVDVEPMITEDDDFETGILTCYLENGDSLVLYNIPPEIARAIGKLRSDDLILDVSNDRDTIYDLLIMLAPRLGEIRNSLNSVVIDYFNFKTMTYRASVYLEIDDIKVKKGMIPSHAIFLALLFNKPVYITDEVLKISRELNENSSEDDEDDFASIA
ncbi:MAG: hypothetical protein DRO09_00230 [Thermoprotei archaeon]|nr:MAG: hypothetical protein DRO09_00230 [Thermoprotei archaeon]